MEIDETGLDNVTLGFLNDLRKFDKDDLINYIFSYWCQLKKEAEYDRKQDGIYMAREFGSVKLTQVNRLRFLAKLKPEGIHTKAISTNYEN